MQYDRKGMDCEMEVARSDSEVLALVYRYGFRAPLLLL